MQTLDSDQHLALLRADVTRIAGAVRVGRDRPVAACPGWTVADLGVHLGIVHRWAAEAVATRATERPTGAKEKYGVPADRPDLADWYEDAAATMLDVLSSADREQTVWTFGDDPTVRFWIRRQANETLVHRWDAQHAVGPDALDPLDPEHAADAVDERVMSLLPPRTAPAADGATHTFHLHRTDGPGEWFLTLDGGGLRSMRAHEKGDVAIRGSAADLLLFVWHRAADGLEVFGTDDPVGAWFALLPAF
jgi:uncharacterized protein (TIGR03083 family)